MDRDESAKELSAKNLDDDDNGPDNKESWVREDAFEDIDLISNLSGANHVENLHEHEEVEDVAGDGHAQQAGQAEHQA